MSDKIRRKIKALRTLIEHPNTPTHEVEAAKGRLKALEDKHGIQPEPERTAPKGPWWGGHETDAERTARQIRERERQYAMFKKRQEQEAKRREAQRRWEARHANSDSRGRPMSDADRREAQKDPLGWAQKQDGRTRQQKNQDLQDEFSHKWKRESMRSRCLKQETFFDIGGEPRPRNEEPTVCVRCSHTLEAREGVLITQNGVTWTVCGEKVPGPRRKKPGRG